MLSKVGYNIVTTRLVVLNYKSKKYQTSIQFIIVCLAHLYMVTLRFQFGAK